MASSLITKPLTSLCNSKSKSCQETPFLQRCRFGVNSLSFKNFDSSSSSISSIKVDKKKASFSSIISKAISIEKQAQTEIEGLNIAEDVTQVCFHHLFLLVFHLNFHLGCFFLFWCLKTWKKCKKYSILL